MKKQMIMVLTLGLALLSLGAVAEVILKTDTWWSELIASIGSIMVAYPVVAGFNWILRKNLNRLKLMLSLGTVLFFGSIIIYVKQGNDTWWLTLISIVGVVLLASVFEEWTQNLRKKKNNQWKKER